jgi:hypothetical protein
MDHGTITQTRLPPPCSNGFESEKIRLIFFFEICAIKRA